MLSHPIRPSNIIDQSFLDELKIPIADSMNEQEVS